MGSNVAVAAETDAILLWSRIMGEKSLCAGAILCTYYCSSSSSVVDCLVSNSNLWAGVAEVCLGGLGAWYRGGTRQDLASTCLAM